MKRVLVLLLLVGLVGGGIRPIHAHGGGTPQLINVEVGPHLVSAWTQPDPLVPGTVHVTVSVAERLETERGRIEPGEPILNQAIRLEIADPAPGSAPTVLPVTHGEAENKLLYEVDFEIDAPGDYQLTLLIDGAGNVPFTLAVEPPPLVNWTVVGGVALVALLAGWFLWQRRTEARAEPRRPLAEGR